MALLSRECIERSENARCLRSGYVDYLRVFLPGRHEFHQSAYWMRPDWTAWVDRWENETESSRYWNRTVALPFHCAPSSSAYDLQRYKFDERIVGTRRNQAPSCDPKLGLGPQNCSDTPESLRNHCEMSSPYSVLSQLGRILGVLYYTVNRNAFLIR
jgi:hypothetical protein